MIIKSTKGKVRELLNSLKLNKGLPTKPVNTISAKIPDKFYMQFHEFNKLLSGEKRMFIINPSIFWKGIKNQEKIY